MDGLPRKIANLGNVQLCGGGGGGGGGGGRSRESLNSAVGNMVLDHWDGKGVSDPVSYFQAEFRAGGVAAGELSRTNPEAILTTEKVLTDSFPGGFEATLNVVGISGVRDRVSRSVGDALANTGVRVPACPGFRDMIMHLPVDHQIKADLPGRAGSGDVTGSQADALATRIFTDNNTGGTAGRFADRDALALTLGAAILDYFNGYPVGDIGLGYLQNGGSNAVVFEALQQTFGGDFEGTMDQRASGGGGGGSRIGTRFRAALIVAMRKHGVRSLPDRAFRDLPNLFAAAGSTGMVGDKADVNAGTTRTRYEAK